MYHARARTRKRQGFTLIELLVVMAIIATLASMVTAAIFKAVEISKQTTSINHLGNNLGPAMIMYSDSNNGCMPNESVILKSGKGAGSKGSFYTAILDYVDEQNNDPANPRPVKIFVNPSRREVREIPWRDYGYVGSQALGGGGGGAAVLDDQNPVTITQISNSNGMSKTALLSTLWMEPKQYNSDQAKWSDFPNAASKAENVPDRDQSGQGAIGAPHPGANPHLFCDRHVTKVPYRWDPQQYPLLWNWSNTQHVSPP
jgi:prepilin-type N-terminal cleavage/methylation domain-containing protein